MGPNRLAPGSGGGSKRYAAPVPWSDKGWVHRAGDPGVGGPQVTPSEDPKTHVASVAGFTRQASRAHGPVTMAALGGFHKGLVGGGMVGSSGLLYLSPPEELDA